MSRLLATIALATLTTLLPAADLSGRWKDSHGGLIDMVHTGKSANATGANAIVTRWWTTGEGTLNGDTIRMIHKRNGRTTDDVTGRITTPDRIDWSNGSHWLRQAPPTPTEVAPENGAKSEMKD